MKKHILVLTLALLAPLAPAYALDRLITVTGEGMVSVPPDMANIQVGVTTQASNARDASDANAKKMAALLAVIKAAGVADADVQTTQISLQPQYSSGNTPRITGFQATNQVTIRVRNLAAVSTVLDRTIAAGANDVSGIEFVVSQRSKAMDLARKDAIEDARRKADIYASAAGAKVGPVVSISEGGYHMPVVRPNMMRAARDVAPAPVAPGEQQLNISVSVTFELTN